MLEMLSGSIDLRQEEESLAALCLIQNAIKGEQDVKLPCVINTSQTAGLLLHHHVRNRIC